MIGGGIDALIGGIGASGVRHGFDVVKEYVWRCLSNTLAKDSGYVGPCT